MTCSLWVLQSLSSIKLYNFIIGYLTFNKLELMFKIINIFFQLKNKVDVSTQKINFVK